MSETVVASCPHADRSKRTLTGRSVEAWWPDRLPLDILSQNGPALNPHGDSFDYRTAFAALDLDAVKADLKTLMTDSQPWWPADYGHYGPLFIRMAWHSAGTYRTADGRGGSSSGAQRLAPLNSWPDNGNLDKARRLLLPIKLKYGRALSWGDLMILAGNAAIESMGGPVFGFGGGREDIWEPERDVYWGRETVWLGGDERYSGERELESPLAAVQMGLIYVNPEGPEGRPDPVASAFDIRDTFARMGMNDEETVALVAGGHTFGKCHGAGDPGLVGPAPEGAPMALQGLGWANANGTGMAGDAITSGLEGAWTPAPTQWDNGYFHMLFDHQWELTKSPAGAWQWAPLEPHAEDYAPSAHAPMQRVTTIMSTADLALRFDPAYAAIARRFRDDPDAFADAFARAWFKLCHRDMGPKVRYLGPDVPNEDLIWQDPLPQVQYPHIDAADIETLKTAALTSGPGLADLVATAWASASTFRKSDRRGGANGARIMLEPQRSWVVNEPERLGAVLAALSKVKAEFDKTAGGGKRVSMADLIVLAGGAALEQAAWAGGAQLRIPFAAGRVDCGPEHTDPAGFAVLEPRADAFRNYAEPGLPVRTEDLMIDRAHLLGLTVPEMAALVGGLRAIGVTHGRSAQGVLTDRVGMLTNDFFVNLLDMDNVWSASADELVFTATSRSTGEVRWTATRADLVFGSDSRLRAIAEVFAASDGADAMMRAFGSAWIKVMNADRFDLAQP